MDNHRTQPYNLSLTEKVYALILNADGKVLVRQEHTNGSISLNWTMLWASMADNQDPVTIARCELSRLGYQCTHWVYLGSYANSEGRINHFLFARDARESLAALPGKKGVEWVSLRDLRYALLDGRIGQVSDATSIALTMYLMALHQRAEAAASSPSST